MNGLVLKEWAVGADSLDNKGNVIRIAGRKAGLISWLLTLMGIDPTVHFRVSKAKLEFRSTSLSGKQSRMIPLQNISSTFYGYYKPWKEAVGIFVLSFFIIQALTTALSAEFSQRMMILSMASGVMIATLLGILVAVIYYKLNHLLTIGVVEVSGVVSSIRFKRSIIEGIDVDDTQSAFVCDTIEHLIDSKRDSFGT
jgi:hypothetical protein